MPSIFIDGNNVSRRRKSSLLWSAGQAGSCRAGRYAVNPIPDFGLCLMGFLDGTGFAHGPSIMAEWTTHGADRTAFPVLSAEAAVEVLQQVIAAQWHT
jgi:hypothetical protein